MRLRDIPAAASIVVASAAAVLIAAGCMREPRRPPVGHYVDPGGLPHHVSRVAFLPLANETAYPSVEGPLQTVLAQAIQQRRAFHLDVRTTNNIEPGLAVDAGRPLSLKDLARLRQALGCDAILVGSLRHYEPHPAIRTALYLRLLDLRDSRVLWSVDHTWDATDKQTQQRLEEYFKKHRGKGYEPVAWQVATLSPAAFHQFIAHEVAQTLPSCGQGP